MIAEKSLRPRQNFARRCWIALSSEQPLAECSLDDISHDGARLILDIEVTVPALVDLYLTFDGSVGRNCKVTRQSGKELGLQFVGRAVPIRSVSENSDAVIADSI
jgi:hypothetical protein